MSQHPGSSTRRRNVRRAAIQALYQFDALPDPDFAEVRETLGGSAGGPEVHEDAFAMALAAWTDRDRSDDMVTTAAPQWPIRRLASMDRAILRLACWEMLDRAVPPGVVINEAVELAREFSTAESPGFVNGVLDAVRRSAGIGEPPAEPIAEPATEPVVEVEITPVDDRASDATEDGAATS